MAPRSGPWGFFGHGDHKPSPFSRVRKRRPRRDPAGVSERKVVLRSLYLPCADQLLDLLAQRLPFPGPPPVVLFLPMAGLLLHQPALGNLARLPFEVAVLARVAHRQSPPFRRDASSVSHKQTYPLSPRG